MISLKNTLKLLVSLFLLMVSASQADTSMTYIHTDHLGSPIAATDEAGQVKWTEEYQPFGVQRTNQDSDNNTGFTGHQYDDELELTYMQARWYHPEVGRFMALDPLLYRDVYSFNRYVYANDNPYKYIDPDGRVPVIVPIVVFIAKELAAEAVEEVTGVPMPTIKNAAKYAAKKVAKDGVKDQIKKRPSNFRKKNVKDSWDNAKDGSRPNSKQCPDCKKDVFGNPHNNEKRNGPDGWDNDHQPKWKDRNLEDMDRKQILDEYNKGTRLRCKSCNRSDNQ